MAAEVREQIMALLAIEPQTPSILRQLEFLERDLVRLEAPPAPAPGNYPVPVNFIVLFTSYILHICILFAFDEFHLMD